jgi:hypothetical protein
MKKSKQAKKAPIANEIVPNKAAAPAVAAPVTLTEHYAHWYGALFNKLPKDQQEALTANLAKGLQIVRGEKREFANVRDFTRAVIEKAEAEFDKLEAKKRADAEKVKSAK